MNQHQVVPGKNSFCGPFAVGYCAGVSPDDVSRFLRRETGRRSITDMGIADIESSLEYFDCDTAVEVPLFTRPDTTLAEWFKNRSDVAGCYVVFVMGHFLVVDGNKLYDNNIKEGMPFWMSHRLQQRVLTVWKIGSVGLLDSTEPIGLEATTSKPPDEDDLGRIGNCAG